MNGILKISEAANMAIHAMVILSANQGELVRVNQVADKLGLSEAHLGQVFQRLSKAGLVKSRRGPHGGFTLKRQPNKIQLLDVYQCIDGPMNDDSCLLGRQMCDLECCVFGDLHHQVKKTVKNYLSNTTLYDICESNAV